jgi:hypothetical protein
MTGTIGLVLDASAMVAYARGSEAVGELIVLLGEERRDVALPVVALADAFGRSDESRHAMLRVLLGVAGAVPIPLDPIAAAAVGVLGRRLGLGVAHAVVLAAAYDAYLVTADASALRGLVDDDLIIEV